MSEAIAIVQGQLNIFVVKLIFLVITVTLFAIAFFYVARLIKIPQQFQKGLAGFVVLIGVYVWFKYFIVSM